MIRSKFQAHVTTGEKLANQAIDEWDGTPSQFGDILTDDGDVQPKALAGWWVIQWPDHCVTEQHLGDANYWGPYATEDEAQQEANSRNA